MQYDNLDPPDDLSPGDGIPPAGYPATGRPTPDDHGGPVADREVPLPGSQAMLLVNEWLDGEATLSMVRSVAGGNEAADLWTRINSEAELLKSRTTPLYVHKRIMEALPDDLHRARQPWYQRTVQLTPVRLILLALALLGVGALVARFAAR